MAKRKDESETKEERRERKRRKKEAKQRRKSQEIASREKNESKDDADAGQHSIEEPSNVFIRKTLELAVSLVPGALGDVQKGIEDSLRGLLLKYSDGLQGILLAFDNIKILQEGMIMDELPHIHYKVSVSALIFAPEVGCRLSGVVTESFHSHLSLVVHHYFNASIPAENLRQAGFEFDDLEEQWFWKPKEGDSSTVKLARDDAITFECLKIHESGGIISLVGTKPFVPPERL